MPVTLTLTGKTPVQTQFGLDTFTENYKCDATADVVLTDDSVPAIGAAHPDYPFMFVTGRYCIETSESASALDLTYMGCLTDDGEEGPNLPIGQHESDSTPQSVTGQYAGGFTVDAPVSIQFNALVNQLTWVSTTPGTLGPSGDVDDPTGDPVIIAFTFTLQSIPGGFTGDLQVFWTTNMFTIITTTSLESEEIVVGQYWRNVKRKTKAYIPLSTIV